jgi:hypothetical protein
LYLTPALYLLFARFSKPRVAATNSLSEELEHARLQTS